MTKKKNPESDAQEIPKDVLERVRKEAEDWCRAAKKEQGVAVAAAATAINKQGIAVTYFPDRIYTYAWRFDEHPELLEPGKITEILWAEFTKTKLTGGWGMLVEKLEEQAEELRKRAEELEKQGK